MSRAQHGLSRGPDGQQRPEYFAWHAMTRRCGDENHPGYPDYGARGIQVCAEWADSFETFYRDMGDRPTPKHSLDRIDNDGNYEPGNCRWTTRVEQARNGRPSVRQEAS